MFGRGRKKQVIERSGIGRHLLRSDKRLLRNRDITASKAPTQFEERKTQPCKDPQQLSQISRYQKALPLLMEKLAKLPPVTSLPNTADRKSRNGREEVMIILLVLGFGVDRHIHKELTPEEAERLRLEVANIKRSYRDDFVHDSTMMEALFYCGYQAVASGLPL